MNNMSVDIGVIIERLDNLKEQGDSNKSFILSQLAVLRAENKDQHSKLQTAQNYTNGKVRKLQIWKGFITGVAAVIVFLAGYIIMNYFALIDTVTAQKVAIERMDERMDNIEDYKFIMK